MTLKIFEKQLEILQEVNDETKHGFTITDKMIKAIFALPVIDRLSYKEYEALQSFLIKKYYRIKSLSKRVSTTDTLKNKDNYNQLLAYAKGVEDLYYVIFKEKI